MRAAVLFALFFAPIAQAEGIPDRAILSAQYGAPTERYAHGVLGDAIEYGSLELRVDKCPSCALRQLVNVTITLPQSRVFEDIAPRLVDLDGDGAPEVVVIESDMSLGASLAIYDEDGKVAQTPHIGRSNRWLAPLGAADLDGDGLVELAYIDRPHLAKTLRIWRFVDGTLEHVADSGGLTNHRIGQDFISGGIRDCGNGPEIVTADADWQNVMAVRLTGAKVQKRTVAPFDGTQSFKAALECRAL